MMTVNQGRNLHVDQFISHTGRDIAQATQLIMRPDVTLAACSLEHNTKFVAACADYEQFARSNNLTPVSDCFYMLGETDKQNGLCFLLTSSLEAGGSNQQLLEYTKLYMFFSNIGFALYYPLSTDIIIRQALANRQLLADLFPGTANDITTQINISSTFRQPHIHNDIACAMEICGPTTIFIDPNKSKDLPLRFHREHASDFMFGFVKREPSDTSEVVGSMSIRRHQLALFKGAKTHELPFGDPRNFDMLHCSPADRPGEPRMLIVSFVTPPHWGEMKFFKRPAPVDK